MERTNLFEMNGLLLIMEFERLVELESKGERDEDVSYTASDLREQMEWRLNEFDAIH